MEVFGKLRRRKLTGIGVVQPKAQQHINYSITRCFHLTQQFVYPAPPPDRTVTGSLCACASKERLRTLTSLRTEAISHSAGHPATVSGNGQTFGEHVNPSPRTATGSCAWSTSNSSGTTAASRSGWPTTSSRAKPSNARRSKQVRPTRRTAYNKKFQGRWCFRVGNILRRYTT